MRRVFIWQSTRGNGQWLRNSRRNAPAATGGWAKDLGNLSRTGTLLRHDQKELTMTCKTPHRPQACGLLFPTNPSRYSLPAPKSESPQRITTPLCTHPRAQPTRQAQARGQQEHGNRCVTLRAANSVGERGLDARHRPENTVKRTKHESRRGARTMIQATGLGERWRGRMVSRSRNRSTKGEVDGRARIEVRPSARDSEEQQGASIYLSTGGARPSRSRSCSHSMTSRMIDSQQKS